MSFLLAFFRLFCAMVVFLPMVGFEERIACVGKQLCHNHCQYVRHFKFNHDGFLYFKWLFEERCHSPVVYSLPHPLTPRPPSLKINMSLQEFEMRRGLFVARAPLIFYSALTFETSDFSQWTFLLYSQKVGLEDQSQS